MAEGSEVSSSSKYVSDRGAVVSKIDSLFAGWGGVWYSSGTSWTLHYYLMNTYIVDAHFEFFLRSICFKCKNPAELAQYLHHFVKVEKQNPLDIGLGLSILFTSFLSVLVNAPSSIVYPSAHQDETASLTTQSGASFPDALPEEGKESCSSPGKQQNSTFPAKAVLEESSSFIELMMETLTNLQKSPAIISRQVFEFTVEHVVSPRECQTSRWGGFSNSDVDLSRSYLCKIKPNIVMAFLAKFYEGAAPPQSLTARIQSLLASPSRQEFIDALNLVVNLGFQSKVDCHKILQRCLKSNTISEAKKFVKGDSKRTAMLLEMMNTNQHAKQAADIIKEFKLEPTHFPKLVQRVQKVATRYYIARFIKNTPDDQDYLSLTRIQDLFQGKTSMLAYSAEELEYKGYVFEAAYLILKHSLQPLIRKNSIHSVKEQICFKLNLPPDTELQVCLEKGAEHAKPGDSLPDEFGPIEKEEDNKLPLMRLEKPVNLVFKTEDIEKMKTKLSESTMIGMDTEWKPVFTKFDKGRAALFQVANQKEAFLIDLIALNTAPELDSALASLFINKSILKVGFSFQSDLAMILKSYPHMECFRMINPFVDVQRQYKEVMGVAQQISLAKASQALLGKRICKKETSSNWERRPLRQSQIHYAALDAYVLLEIHNILSAQTDIPAIETLSLSKQDSEQSEQLKEKPPVVEEQGVTAKLYSMKSSDSTQPNLSKEMICKNIESASKILSEVMVLDQGTGGLKKYLSQLKIMTDVRQLKFKALLESLKEGEVLLTSSQKIYEEAKGEAMLFRERNTFKQLKQLCAYLEVEMPSEKSDYDPGEIWA